MTRQFRRMVCEDDRGNRISGAWVHVYEAGTTTEVALYDAETGGSVLLQPQTTDADGVVEAWTDERGSLDVVFSDSGLARLPSGQRVRFSSFTATHHQQAVTSPDIREITVMTASDYAALNPPDPETLYVLV